MLPRIDPQSSESARIYARLSLYDIARVIPALCWTSVLRTRSVLVAKHADKAISHSETYQ